MTAGDTGRGSSKDLVREARRATGGSPDTTGGARAPESDAVDTTDGNQPTDLLSDSTPTPFELPREVPAKTSSDWPAEAESSDTTRGVLFGLAAAVVGAVAWALLLAYGDMRSWLLAMGIGYAVGRAAGFGAGTVTFRLKVIIGALVLGAVVLGELLGMALVIYRAFGVFDVPLSVELYLEILGVDTLFVLGGAILGVFGALRSVEPAPPAVPELLKP